MQDLITARATMQEVLRVFPGAQRALFRKYHIGGCSSCGFRPDETLAGVCERNEGIPADEALEYIRQSHEEDARILMEPSDLAERRNEGMDLRLVDIRSREEFEAVHIEGSILLTQDFMLEILGKWDNDQLFVIIDHQGKKSLDAAAYYLGHGMTQVHALRGGIDAWSMEVDNTVRRYVLN